jgi:6-phosphogluconolactonase
MKTLLILVVTSVLASGLIGFSATGRAAENSRAPMVNGSFWVYVGTYTGPKSKGIYGYRLEASTGILQPLGLLAETVNPTFLALHPNGRFLYAANEVGNYQGKSAGYISGFAVDAGTGKLTPLNEQSSKGPGPCHLLVDPSGKNVLVANYSGGSVAVLPVLPDGRLGEATFFIQHQGSSVNRQRQQGPHAHGIVFDARYQRAWIADLGLDKVMGYRLDAARGLLTPGEPPFVVTQPGAGPRHLAIDSPGRFAYVINEINSTIQVYAYNGERGEMKPIQVVSTLPPDFTGNSTTAEIEIHPSGKFLYGSNRGHDSVAVLGIDAQTGRLTLIEHQSTQGKVPRNFGIDPTGSWLLAAHQNSDSIVTFRIDPSTGRLQPTGQKVEVGAPVCLKFLRAP